MPTSPRPLVGSIDPYVKPIDLRRLLTASAILLLASVTAHAQTVIVSGSADGKVDGNYGYVGNIDGKPAFQNAVDSEFMVQWSSANERWEIFTTADGTVFYGNRGNFDDFVPRLDWVEVDGDSPAPILSGSATTQPLAGTYRVGSTAPSAAAKTSVVDYGSMDEAIDSLNANGISDDVTFEIVAGLVEDQVVINYFPSYTSPGDSVLITPESGVVEWTIDRTSFSSPAQNFSVKIDGAHNITIDGIKFTVGATDTYGAMIAFSDTDNFRVRNCELVGRVNPPYDSNHYLADRGSTANNDVVFEGNLFVNGRTGVQAVRNVKIVGNDFRYQKGRAIDVFLGDGALIADNEIQDSTGVTLVTVSAIYALGSDTRVSGNVLDLEKSGRGISLEGSGSVIENNMVAMHATTATAGLNLYSSQGNTVRFNTVYVPSSSGPALVISDGDSSSVHNNILVNTGGGPAMSITGPDAAIVTSNFNNFYTTGAYVVELSSGACCATLPFWQVEPHNPDLGSVAQSVNFVSTTSPSDLHLTGASIGDNSLAGVSMTAVTEDIDGDTRNDPPYMGADEASTPLVAKARVDLDLKVFLEGNYAGSGAMSNTLNTAGYLDSGAQAHPYGGAPWNYGGSDIVPPGFFALNKNIVDWIYVRLYTGDINGSLTMAADTVGVLETDGTVSLPSGAPFQIDLPAPGTYYVAVYHRNHIGVIAEAGFTADRYGLTIIPDINFDNLATVFGTNPLKDFGDGSFGLYAGDFDADGQVIASDFNAWLIDTKAGSTGYLESDFNMDGQVNAADFNIWLSNTKAGAASQIP